MFFVFNILIILFFFLISCISFKWNIYSLFFVIPFIYLLKRLEFYVQNTGIYYNPISILPEVLVLVAIFRLLIEKLIKKTNIHFDNITKLVFLLIIATFLSAVLSCYSLQVGIFGFRTVGIPMFCYFLGRHYFVDENRFIGFLRFIVFLGVIVAIYGLWQQFVGLPPWDVKWLNEEALKNSSLSTWFIGSQYSLTELRKFSTLSHIATASSMYVISFLFAYMLIQIGKVQYLVAIIIIFLGLIFTYSRAGIISALLIPVFFEIFKSRISFVKLLYKLYKAFIIVSLLLIIGIGIISVFHLSERAMQRLSLAIMPLKDSSFKTRTNILWKFAINKFLERPLFGWGVGSTGGVAERFVKGSAIGVDSLYFKILVEQGIVGIVVWIVFLIILIKELFYIKKHTVKNRFLLSINTGCVVLIFIFLFIGIIGCPTELQSFAVPFWFFLGSIKFLKQNVFKN